MNLNEMIWKEINSTPGLAEASKTSLHTRIMRLVEVSQTSPVGQKLGVTVMTQASSAAGDKQASNRHQKPLAGDAKPKSI